MTEEVVAPLDAYVTAKPDEPTFTLQGGDPLAAPMVRAWAFLARRRCGIVRFEAGFGQELIEAAIGHSVENDEREHDNLLLRATAAEEVSWTMDAYVKSGHATEKPTEAADTHLTELARIDLHDVRVRVAQKLSNFRCELIEMAAVLADAGFSDEQTITDMRRVATGLISINAAVEPRRILKKD